MAKKPTVTTLQSGFNSTEVLNQNFEALRDAFDNTLSLDGSTPNAMEADLDLNGNNIMGATGLLINGTDYLADVEAAKAAALVAQSAAELAENNAETAEVNAEASETAAASSASAASTSATNAATSATAASVSETAAALSETNAATSETNASTSETNASASALAASTSETNAASSETAAALSETNASTSETNASASESAASTSETNAATSATNAATSETNAAASEAASSASAAAALTSETAAALSEANASASETAAGLSETAAATSETNAATSEANASTSASNAASSAASAQASKDAALEALDSFDDRYLGQKAADPTVDNDGNALVSGALYYNTTDAIMKVYDGSLWVAAYASLSGAMFGANNLSDVADAAGSRSNLGLGTGDSPTFAGLNTTGDVSFGDNDKAIFGAGGDFQIVHDGNNSYISDFGTGSIWLKSNGPNISLLDGSNNYMVRANTSNSVDLYHNTAKKLSTTSTGIDVTGTVTADGLTVDGNILDNAGFKVKGYYTNNAADGYNVNLGVTGNTGYLQSLNGLSLNTLSLDADTLAVRTGSSYRNRLNIGSGGDISFYEDTGTTPKFFWDASAESLGIGTSSPTGDLTIGTSSPRIDFLESNGSTGFDNTILIRDNDVFSIQTRNGGNFVSNDYRSTANASGALTHEWRIGNAEKMRINSSGNVGIGTSSPNTELDVFGGVRSTSSGGYNQITTTSIGDAAFSNNGNNWLTVKNGVPANAMRIDSSGNLLVGTTSGSDKVVVNGTVSATNFNTTSDATLKTNVETLTGSLDAVNALRGVSFDWIENGGSEVGFIAQEVEEVLPEVVSTNDQGIKSVKYGNMVAVLVEALKEQQLRIEALEAKLEG